MSGGNGTLAGGDGSDAFALTYSATKSLSAVIEDLEPARDKIVVNFDGDASNEAWEVLRLTNNVRETQGRSLLTASDGLTEAASVRAQELTTKPDHSRPESVGGGGYSTVFDEVEVGKHYPNNGENITAGSSTAAEAMSEWISSLSHHKNILSVNPSTDSRYIDYCKLGVGYAFVEEGSLSSEEHYYWEQLFGGSLSETETVTVDSLLAAASVISIGTVSAVVTLTEGNDTYSNSVFGATIKAFGGDDSIRNSGFNVSISGGNDNDTIDNSGSFTTINAGLGNDRINLNAAQEVPIQPLGGNDYVYNNNSRRAVYVYKSGNDTIEGFNDSDRLNIGGYTCATEPSGSDIVVNIIDNASTIGTVTLKDYSGQDVNIVSTASNPGTTISNVYGSVSVIGTAGDDSINNYASNVTITGLAGNDSIHNGDIFDSFYGSNIIIEGGTGNDFIENYNENVTINGGAGHDLTRGCW